MQPSSMVRLLFFITELFVAVLPHTPLNVPPPPPPPPPPTALAS